MKSTERFSAERFIRRMYGLNIRLVDRTANGHRELSIDDAVKLIEVFAAEEESQILSARRLSISTQWRRP